MFYRSDFKIFSVSSAKVVWKSRSSWLYSRDVYKRQLDVWGVHGVGGIIGTILLGIFASKDVNGISGLIEGDVHQFGIQIFGTLLASAYAFVITMLILKVVNKFLPVRVTPEEERIGLDASLHHEEAYHL